MRLLNKFYFKVKGKDEIYRAILVDKELWAINKMSNYYFGKNYILDKFYNGDWELINL